MGKENHSCKIIDEKGKSINRTFSTTNSLCSDFVFGKIAHSKDQHFSFAGMIKSKKEFNEAFIVVLGVPSDSIRASFLMQVKKMIDTPNHKN